MSLPPSPLHVTTPPLHRGAHDYTLVLNPDLYCKKHVQWYYFRLSHMKTGTTYTFHIVNFEKSDSLYNHGVCVCVCVCMFLCVTC